MLSELSVFSGTVITDAVALTGLLSLGSGAGFLSFVRSGDLSRDRSRDLSLERDFLGASPLSRDLLRDEDCRYRRLSR